jgi:hypothetical protein
MDKVQKTAFTGCSSFVSLQKEFVFQDGVVVSWICHIGKCEVEISGSHGSEYEDDCVLECYTV